MTMNEDHVECPDCGEKLECGNCGSEVVQVTVTEGQPDGGSTTEVYLESKSEEGGI